MNKFLIALTLGLISLLIYGCATVTPNMLHSKPIMGEVVPETGKALVIFIRPNELGYPIHASVHDGDKLIGIVPYNQKLPYQAEPGHHLFMAVSEAADFMTADLVAGKTYYVEVVPRMGAWRARFSLKPVTKEDLTKEEVKNWIETGRFIENRQSAYEWEVNNKESILKKKDVYYAKWLKKPEQDRPHLKAEDGI